MSRPDQRRASIAKRVLDASLFTFLDFHQYRATTSVTPYCHVWNLYADAVALLMLFIRITW